MYDIPAMIRAISDAVSKIASAKEASIENQSITDEIKTKNKLVKSNNHAQDIVALALKYQGQMTKQDSKQLENLIKKFNKDN